MSGVEWVGLGLSVVSSLLAAGTVYGVLSERVRKLGDEMRTRVAREEFDAGMKRLDELHRDLREIRDLLLQVLTKGATQ